MRWNVSNNKKKKSLLERLVNVEDVPSAHERIPIAVIEREVFEKEPEPIIQKAVKTPRRSVWKNLVVTSDSSEDEIETDNASLEGTDEYQVSDGRKIYIKTESDPEPELEVAEDESTIPAIDSSISDTSYFDMLERAKESESQPEEVKLEYKIPKRVYTEYQISNDNTPSETMINLVNEHLQGDSSLYEKINLDEPQIISEPVVVNEPIIVVEATSSCEDDRSAIASEQLLREQTQDVPDNVTYPEFPQESETPESIQEDALPVESVVVTEPPVLVQNPITQKPVWVQRSTVFEKVIFPEEYFYAKNGTVIRTVPQLRHALHQMDDDTFTHHSFARGVNDFANWIRHVFKHDECADRLCQAQNREEMLGVMDSYL